MTHGAVLRADDKRLVLKPMADRIMANIMPIPFAGCWIWMGPLNASGYGQIKVRYRIKRAHRVAYETFVGPIPVRMTLDHLCRVRSCVNPDHLEVVTNAENIKRGRHPGREQTHCVHGHPLNGDNIYQRPGKVERACRACQRRRNSEYKRRRRGRAR